MSPVNMQKPTKKKPFDVFTLVMTVVFVIVGIAAGFGAYYIVLDLISKNTSLTSIPGIAIADENTPVPGSTEAIATQMMAIPDSATTPEPYTGSERVNVLLMGLDYRDWTAIQKNEPSRTDSMILFTYDPITKSAGFLSIPRDMWVAIPGYDYGKINTAHFLGQFNNLPGSGPALATKTVENFLGIKINYYAEVDFTAFTKFIDSIGCIDLKIRKEEEGLVIDPVGIGNTIVLEAGTQMFCGEQALAYARARHSENGDFDRATRQQAVIMAIRSQVLNIYSLPRLVAIAPQLYEELSAGIKTNLPLDTAIQLAWAIKDIPKESIKNSVIASDMVAYGSVIGSDGVKQDVIKPLPDKIRVMRDDMFATNSGLGPSQSDLAAAVKAEGAHITLQNGTTDAAILARTQAYLQGLGFVVDVSNVAGGTAVSLINIYNSKPYAIKFLSQTMNIPTSQISYKVGTGGTSDILLIIGNDWATSNPMPN